MSNGEERWKTEETQESVISRGVTDRRGTAQETTPFMGARVSRTPLWTYLYFYHMRSASSGLSTLCPSLPCHSSTGTKWKHNSGKCPEQPSSARDAATFPRSCFPVQPPYCSHMASCVPGICLYTVNSRAAGTVTWIMFHTFWGYVWWIQRKHIFI